ncbi:MAG: efflux RND transporter permease subunit, partial [Helicobacter sp.]|nr:efflux RND transporter permease subunit [Helicobacter sp.]
IVVIENIYKKLELGLSKVEAAYEGVKEISFALIAISAMLLAVFVPIANMSGVVGRFFTSFSITLVAAILISYCIVITFIPMLSARIADAKRSLFYHKSEKYFKALESLYVRILEWVLARYILVILAIFSLFVISLFLIARLGVEFLPSEDKAEFDIKILAKPGISIEEMQRQTLEIQKFLETMPEVQYSLLNIGFTAEKKVYEAKIYVHLVPYNKRERTQGQIIETLRNSYSAYSEKFNIDITIIEIPQISLGEDDSPFQMALYSLDNEKLRESLQKLLDFMQTSGKFRDIHTDIKDKTPEYKISINRAIASEYGFSAKEIALALNSAFSGTQ